MRLAFQLAYKNLMGAGLRTWLNAAVLSFAFVVMLFFNGLIDGWNLQATRDSIDWEYGMGQLRHEAYDPYDPFSIKDSHGTLPESVGTGLTPILIRQASIYPGGRMLPVALKGIAADQQTLALPTDELAASTAAIPAIVGNRMASSANLEVGDQVLLRWRDKNGTFDARNVTIVAVFDTNVATIDDGQLWVPIERLWQMTGLHQEATLFVAATQKKYEIEGWSYQSQTDLLSDLTELIETKKVSSSIWYVLLLSIALLAIFDTQVLSIFRRQKEIGTYIALGMTRWQVV